MKTVEEIALDSAGDAAEALLDRQFRAPGIQALPEGLHACLFDHYLLSGRQAIIALQSVLIRFGETCPSTGIICPATVKAARNAVARFGTAVLHGCARARRDQAYHMAYANRAIRPLVSTPDGNKGIRITAAEAFLPPDIHLTQAEHRERISAWK